MTTAKRIRPGRRTEADQRVQGGDPNSVQSTAGDRLAAMLSGVYVVVVEVDGDHARRRVYLNLPAAQRAQERAQERGQTAEVVLAALEPVGVIL